MSEKANISSIECVRFVVPEFSYTDVPPPGKDGSKTPIHLNFDPELWSNSEENRIRIRLTVAVRYGEVENSEEVFSEKGNRPEIQAKTEEVGHVVCESDFQFDDLDSIWEDDEEGAVPADIAALMLSILYSGARGAIAGKAAGSAFATTILPLMDMQDLAKRMKEMDAIEVGEYDPSGG